MRKTDDDLFHDSVMTFGEHLGELRVCLWCAILGLAIGVGAGFFVGHLVVRFIQVPLTSALSSYYESENEAKLREQFGGSIPPEQLRHIKAEHMIFDEVFVDPQAAYQALHEKFPDRFPEAELKPARNSAVANSASTEASKPSDTAAPATTTPAEEDLIPIKLWRKTSEVTQVVGMNPLEAFMVYMKASILVGAILSSPWVFYQLWTFVAAGLYTRERRYVHVFLPASLGLFLGGAALAFFIVFPVVLRFLFQFNSWLGIGITPRISEWLSFVLIMPLCFGLSFQLPLVMLFLERIGIFTVKSYVSQWRVAVLSIFVLAMILSPSPDPGSMMLMASPLVLLYFGGVWLCKRWPRAGRT